MHSAFVVLYCHLWPAASITIFFFSRYLINGTIFENRFPNLKFVFLYSLLSGIFFRKKKCFSKKISQILFLRRF